jgi:hypothetical protein
MTKLRKHHLYKLDGKVYRAVHDPHCDDPECQCSGWYLVRQRRDREPAVLAVQQDRQIGQIIFGDTWSSIDRTLDDLTPVRMGPGMTF